MRMPHACLSFVKPGVVIALIVPVASPRSRLYFHWIRYPVITCRFDVSVTRYGTIR